MENKPVQFVLGFDVALSGAGVAVLETATGRIVADGRAMTRGQSEILVPMIQETMTRAGVGFDRLDLIVTTVGPGGFTGLRIGLSTARSLGLALDIPVAGVRTTDTIIKKIQSKNNRLEGNLLVIIDTKRSDFYFSLSTDVENPGIADAGMLLERWGGQSMVLAGDGVPRLHSELGSRWPSAWQRVDGYDLPDPEMLARLGYDYFQAGTVLPPEPLYLRGADVSQSKQNIRSIAES